MNARDAAEELRREHEETAALVTAFEHALELVASEADEPRDRGLTWLREMAPRLAHQHATPEEGMGGRPPVALLIAEGPERARLRGKLFELGRAGYEFRKELGFATTLDTEDLLARGRRLLAELQQEMEYEEELLDRAEAREPGETE